MRNVLMEYQQTTKQELNCAKAISDFAKMHLNNQIEQYYRLTNGVSRKERNGKNEKVICKRAYERQNRRGNQSKYSEDEENC